MLWRMSVIKELAAKTREKQVAPNDDKEEDGGEVPDVQQRQTSTKHPFFPECLCFLWINGKGIEKKLLYNY